MADAADAKSVKSVPGLPAAGPIPSVPSPARAGDIPAPPPTLPSPVSDAVRPSERPLQVSEVPAAELRAKGAPRPAARAEAEPQPARKGLEEAARRLSEPAAPAREIGARVFDAQAPRRDAPATLASPAPAFAQPPTDLNPHTGRLSRHLRPKSYDLRVVVDPDSERFSGRVRIAARAAKRTRTVTLHALGLEIRSGSVNGRAIDPRKVVYDRKTETAMLVLEEELPAGPAAIELEYAGDVGHQMKGLYQSTAKHKGVDEKYLFTQFEATDARKMLPCFDEPDFKARFKLTVTAPERFTVLSNMPALSERREAGAKTVAFDETPVMSTYLLALAVARLEKKSRIIDGTEVSVYARPEDMGQVDFAMEAAEAALTRLNRYFGIPYALPKMDLVAVPDFAAGAMENWGAIFFRDAAILIDPKLSSTRAMRRVAETVTHEIVHQWFGNLVTMKWWNDLWLNEAFATWLAYKIVDDWKPEWNSWLSFEARKRDPLSVDALMNTRPIVSKVKTAGQIRAMFDPLSYSKGGSVLQMMDAFLGTDVFRAGVRRYMRRFAGRNTEAQDLWGALEEASGKRMRRLAKDWLLQAGYPELSVAAGEDGRSLVVEQKRFSAHGPSADDSVWTVPVAVRYRLKGERRTRVHRAVLKAGRTVVRLPGGKTALWAYPNAEQTGFYRVALAPSLLSGVLRAAKELSPIERVGLLGDLWAQVKNGSLPIARYLEAQLSLSGDPSRPVVEDSAGRLSALSENLVAEADRPAFRRLAAKALAPHWKRLGWAKKGDDDEDKLARAAVLSAYGDIVREPRLLAELDRRLDAYLSDPAGTDPVLAGPLVSLGAKLGGAERFERYLEQYRRSETPEHKLRYLGALSEFRQPELARRLLDLSLTGEVRGQDVWRIYYMGLANPDTQGLVWDYMRAHWPELRKKAGPTGTGYLVKGLASLWSRAWIAEVQEFFKDPKNREESAERYLQQSLESMELGIRFKETQGPALSAWLKARR